MRNDIRPAVISLNCFSRGHIEFAGWWRPYGEKEEEKKNEQKRKLTEKKENKDEKKKEKEKKEKV